MDLGDSWDGMQVLIMFAQTPLPGFGRKNFIPYRIGEGGQSISVQWEFIAVCMACPPYETRSSLLEKVMPYLNLFSSHKTGVR